MGNGEQDYYRRRIEQESAAAHSASNEIVREVHIDLAARYSEKLRLIDALSADPSFAEPMHLAMVARTAVR